MTNLSIDERIAKWRAEHGTEPTFQDLLEESWAEHASQEPSKEFDIDQLVRGIRQTMKALLPPSCSMVHVTLSKGCFDLWEQSDCPDLAPDGLEDFKVTPDRWMLYDWDTFNLFWWHGKSGNVEDVHLAPVPLSDAQAEVYRSFRSSMSISDALVATAACAPL